MRRVACALMMMAATLVVASIRSSEDEVVWKSLFAPPYDQSAPSIMVSLSCLSRDLCYVPGGSNGNGFGMYSFDGQTNGNFTQMTEPNMTLMILSVAAGGSPKKPKAAFGGIGMLNFSKGLQYLADDATEWLPSAMPQEFLWQTQSLSASPDGNHIISFGQGVNSTWIMHSRDGGKSFARRSIDVQPVQPNCTWPNYAALVDHNTWFVTFGGYTGEHNNNDQTVLKRMSANLVLQQNARTGMVSPKIWPLRNNANAVEVEVDAYMCDYTGQIARTDDGGQTWTNLFTTWEYTITQIACNSARHCVTVGWGVTESDLPFTVILTTTNGHVWRETLRLKNTTISFNDVEFVDANEVWVAGADTVSQYESAGVFYFSKDGGDTWLPYKNMVPNIAGIMDMSFTKDGVGFAAAISLFQTSTILRYAKQSFAGYFTQSNCPFAGCNSYCQNVSFPQGMCLESQGGSVIAACTSDAVMQYVYNTTSCIGPYVKVPMPLGKCINGSSGFFENFCNTSGLNSKFAEATTFLF